MSRELTSVVSGTRPDNIGGYTIMSELGRGAMSVVYRALKDGRPYAVKVLSDTHAGPAAEVYLSFRREAAAIARLNHPSIVEVYEVGEHQGRPFLVMSLAQGETLEARLERGTLDDVECLSIATAVAGALREVHRHGLVHRDVKPGNIVLGPKGKVCLIDFGMVSESSTDELVVGTVQYAPPEQLGVTKRVVGPMADLYALGATIFHCLTGQTPFEGGAPSEIMHRIATVVAPELRDVRPNTRPALSMMVSRLLRKDPDDRYQSASGFLADLQRIAQIDEAIHGGGEVQLQTHSAASLIAHDVELVGRKASYGALSRAWGRATAGDTTFVQIIGAGGSGKTRLAQELVRQLSSEEAFVLAGKCQEHERTPFGPLREAADRIAAYVGELSEPEHSLEVARIRRAAGEVAPLVKRLSGALSEILGDTEEIRALEPSAEQLRFYQALAGFFGNLATAQRPLIMMLDDVQWLDEGSVRVLGFIADRPTSKHLLVVSTCRPTDNEIARKFGDAVSSRAVDPIVLAPLTHSEVAELIRAQLGGRPLDPDTVGRLSALTQGNPFAIGEYLRALMEKGVVRPTTRGWTTTPEEFDSVNLPNDVVQLVLRRLDEADDEVARLVRLAALLGGRFSTARLARVSDSTHDQALMGLTSMRRLGLVEVSFEGTWAFHHDRAREAVVERMSEIERKDAHQAIAEALMVEEPRNTTDLYARARHFGLGHIERDSARVASVNLAAGLAALDEHAYEGAYSMLDLAHRASHMGGNYTEIAGPMLTALGRASAMTGRLDCAFHHLQNAREFAEGRDEQFRIHYLLTLTYASQGRNKEALEALYESFDVLGRPLPQTRVMQFLVLMSTWFMALFMRWTGIRSGSATGDDLEHRLTLSRLHYAGSMIALFEGDTFLMVQFIVRDFYNVHFLRPSAEKAIASSVYGAVLGTFQFESVMKRYTRVGVDMADKLNDQAALAVCHAYEAMGWKWSGSLDRGNQMLLDALPALNREVPGSWYAAMMICEQAYSFMHAARASAAGEHIRANLQNLERTNNLMFRYNTLSVAYAETSTRGNVQDAANMWRELEPQYEALSANAYVKLARSQALLEVMIDREDFGPELEEVIKHYSPYFGEDYYTIYARMLVVYARLGLYETASGAERRKARRKLVSAIRGLRLRSFVPAFLCHAYICEAALAREDKRYKLAEKKLRKAEALIAKVHTPRGTYQVAYERARLAEATGEATARFFANTALEIAHSEGWKRKAQKVIRRFQLEDKRNFNDGRGQTMMMPRSVEQAQRYADALLQVSLASASTLDGDAQARQALEAVARVLGAERALFYLLDADGGALVLKASAGAGAESVSSTVVRTVYRNQRPIVLTGDDAGQTLGSESILTHGLRSIMAAPLMLRDKMIGVVYVDSRLAKGMFDNDDVQLLLGLANHIAIAIETAKNARLEAERSVMQRDFELVGAVQTMMLPRSESFVGSGIRGMGCYQPAAQCGGDWWWHESRPDGSVYLWMGDVSGHGAAPAMITSTVAGSFHTLRSLDPNGCPSTVLRELDRRVAALGGGFHMTMTVVQLDADRRTVRLWNAGGPAVYVLRSKRVIPLAAPGGILGHHSGHLEIGESQCDFQPGDRVMMCTDGVYELEDARGRQVGSRGVVRLLKKSSTMLLDSVSPHVLDHLNGLLAGRPQDDDITYILAEFAGTQNSPNSNQSLPMGKQ